MTDLSNELQTKLDLTYPFEKRWSPEPGEPFEVADGVFWLRMPLPMALDHINLWLLRDGDGWVIVDSGYDHKLCKETWDRVFDQFLTRESVNRIIVTHFHPDHIGLAAWLAQGCECPVLISEGEFRHYHSITHRDPERHHAVVQTFVTEVGFEQKYADMYVGFFNSNDKPADSRVQESMCRFIKGGDAIIIGGREWQVVMGNGHSPEHSCLHCPDLNLMISGDQALPRISSNVSVYATNKHADPLGDWMDSCARLRDNIPADTLVLPAHQEPFIGIDIRMQQLIDEHDDQLDTLRHGLAQDTSANQARALLFERELNDVETIMATGETLSHINYLWHRGELVKTEIPDGETLYRNPA